MHSRGTITKKIFTLLCLFPSSQTLSFPSPHFTNLSNDIILSLSPVTGFFEAFRPAQCIAFILMWGDKQLVGGVED